MQKYHDAVIDEQGNRVTSASIYVYSSGGGLASIFKDDESTAINNPITSADTDNYDSKGNFGFKAANGIYDIKIVAADITWKTERVLYDFNDTSTFGELTVTGAFTSPGIDDNADSNAITIDSSEDVQFVGTAQFAAGEGVVFNGDAIAAANTLDDYEEGTWTPVLSDGTNNATMDIQIGTYEKIGRQVTIRGYISTASLGSVSGNIQIAGLPFAASSDINSRSSMSAGYGASFSITAGYSVGGQILPSGTSILLRLWGSASGTSPMQSTEWSATGFLIFSASYYI